jgi:hypothetical protein
MDTQDRVWSGPVGATPRRTRPARAARVARATQSVMLSPELRQRLRVWAAFRGVEISELVEDAVARLLDELDRTRAAKGLAPIPRPEM